MKDDTRAAAQALLGAYERLRALGWQEIMYCPKDGSWFEAIEAGSCGIHRCQYSGEWPKGHWWISDGGDLWPSKPILWRPLGAADRAQPERGKEPGATDESEANRSEP